MSDEFPGLSLFEGDPDSRFLDLYNRFSSQYPDVGQFLKPDDPDLQAYQKLSTEPTGAEDLIRSYAESMPTHEDYEPTFGRKMAAVALGALSGNPIAAYKQAHEYVDDPYNDALQEWKNQGSKISTEAQLMNSDRTRQLQAMKYGIQTKSQAAKGEITTKLREMAESRRIASEVAAEEARQQREEERRQQVEFQQDMQRKNLELRTQMNEIYKQNILEDNTRANEAAKAKHEKDAAKLNDPHEINQRLNAVASQSGIDVGTLDNQSALVVAGLLAAKRAKSTYPFFANKIMENGDIDPTVDPKTRELLGKYLNQQAQKYLRGEF